MIADFDASGAEQTVREIESAGGAASSVTVDVRRTEDAERAVEAATSAWGRIDILVNNAGVYPMGAALEIDEAQWERVLDLNLKGAFFFARAAAARMVAAGRGGSIINIASINAHRPMGGFLPYNVSKAGLTMLTGTLAVELGRSGIRVNTVTPGGIETPGANDLTQTLAQTLGLPSEHVTQGFLTRIPMARMGTPDDVATAVLFLASQAAAYVTGANLVVDGGYLLS
jgi:NAD(P)-dependent dehydrogenase (short-subunit alcohol dehydrogenase family)